MNNGFYNHNSYLGGLNFLLYNTNKLDKIEGARPPFPIIKSDPSIYEIYCNLNKADFGLFMMTSIFGISCALKSVVGHPSPYNDRVLQFKKSSRFFMISGVLLALYNSCFRLNGKVPNGLKWDYNENPIPKYNFSQEFTEKSLLKYITVNFRQC